jgi:hypothetical protein
MARADPSFARCPFLSPALQRLRGFALSISFTFIINNIEIHSDLIDALALSPAVSGQLSSDPLSRTFVINSEHIQPSHFDILRIFISGEPPVIQRSARRSLVFLCRRLCNCELEQFFATLWSADEAIASLTDLFTPSPLNLVSDISLLSSTALDELLSRGRIQVDTEDQLLRELIALGPEYAALLRHIRFKFLSPQGVADFVDHFLYNNLTEAIWEGILRRFRLPVESALHKPATAPARFSMAVRLDSRIISEFPSLFSEFTGRHFDCFTEAAAMVLALRIFTEGATATGRH